MTAPVPARKGREVKRRPVQGNSPNDRILRGPDCNRPKRVCADSFPATLFPQPPRIEETPGVRFSRQAESIGPMSCQKQNHLNLGPSCRLPLVGARAPVKERDGRSASCSSSAMSSDRLFLDRVARQCRAMNQRHKKAVIHGQNGEGTGRHNRMPGPVAVGRQCSGAHFEPVRPVWPRVA